MHEVTGRTERLLPTVLTDVSHWNFFPFFPQSNREVRKVACSAQTCVLNSGSVCWIVSAPLVKGRCGVQRGTERRGGGCGVWRAVEGLP